MGGLLSTGLARESGLSLSVAGASNVTLTVDQAQNGLLIFTGVLTGNINVSIPDAVAAAGASWIVYNNTTGSFTLTLKTVSGSGIVIVQGFRTEVYSDGTNIAAAVTTLGAASFLNGTVQINGSVLGSIIGSGSAYRWGAASVAITDGADTTLTAAQFSAPFLTLTGALTATRNAIVPNASGGYWIVKNSTTGGFAVTVKTAAGTGIAVAAGMTAILLADGVNVVRVTADA